MNRIYVVFEKNPSFSHPYLIGVFSSSRLAKDAIDRLYAHRFEMLCKIPDFYLKDSSYYYVSSFLNHFL